MVLIPSNEAISQACCPPAPPKLANLMYGMKSRAVCSVMMLWPYICKEDAYPFASVSARIGRHMVSLATLMNLCTLHSFRDTVWGVGLHAPINNFVQTEDFRRIFVDALRKFFELPAGCSLVQRFFLRLAKYLWEVVRDKPPKQQVCVGHCQRATFSTSHNGSCLQSTGDGNSSYL
jgi:hypothetical protein